jgi:hypothetical protein
MFIFPPTAILKIISPKLSTQKQNPGLQNATPHFDGAAAMLAKYKAN